MLKEGQQTNITATRDAFQNGDVAIPRVQLYHIVENIGHSFASQKQVHQFLFGTCLKLKTKQNKKQIVIKHQHKTDWGLIKLRMYLTPNLCGGIRFMVRIRIA